jgi:hypothetical protein
LVISKKFKDIILSEFWTGWEDLGDKEIIYRKKNQFRIIFFNSCGLPSPVKFVS